jgi:sec-independent protein translocase protein TatC
MIFRSKKGSPAGEMPFLDHLEELRWRLLKIILAVLIGAIAGFAVVTRFKVLEILIHPVRPFLQGEKLNFLSPGDPFFITLGLALTVGLILAFPIIVAQIWGFVAPALMPREKKAIVPALYLGLVLFCGGVALAYFIVLPMTLKFMMGFQSESLQQNLVVGNYISFVVKILLAFGILFELPVVVLVLSALGLVTSKFLSEKRRFAIAGMAVVAALVTPGDAVTLTIFMMGPLLILYEMSIALAKLVERRRARSLVESVAIVALLLMAAPASAQQRPQAADTTKPKTKREIVFDRIRTLNQAEQRDTTRGDTTALPTERPATPGRPVGGQQSADFPTDSVMEQLLQLPGFSATLYRGTSAEFSADSSALVLQGKKEEKAGVMRDGQSMLADSLVTFNDSTSQACGYGNPVLSGGTTGSPLSSQRVCYNTRSRVGMALGARTQVTEGANWFVTGDMYSRGTNSYSHDATFTDCSLEEPHYHFALGEMKIVRGDVVVGRNVTLNFGDVPVFWLPFFMQSMKRGRRSGLLMPEFSVNDIVRRSAGYNRRIKDIGFYWAVSDHWGALVSADWWSNNYTALEGSFDYTYPNQFMGGGVTFKRFWENTGGTQFSVSAQHSMEPNERTRVSLDGNYVTSSRFIEERSFDPRELTRSISSNLGLSRRFDWGSLSLQASRDHYLTNDQKRYTLPSLGLNLATISLFGGAATWTGSGQVRRTGTDEANTEADPNELQANVGSSFNWGRLSWSQAFTSTDRNEAAIVVAGTDTTHVLRENHTITWNSSLNFQQRLIGTTTFTPGLTIGGEMVNDFRTNGQMLRAPIRLDFNAELKADIFGFWPGVGKIERIRHRLSPSIRYGFAPSRAIDSIANPLLFEVFPRGGSERNTITIGVNQTFEGKFREDKSRRDAQADSAAADTMTADPTKPRRLPQSEKITILSLTTDAVVYDFVAERELGRGIQTQSITNSINSDLLRGLQLSVTHELFRNVDTIFNSSGREFDPHLQRISASWSLSNNSWLFRALGLARETKAPPQTGSTETPTPEGPEGGPAPGPQYGIIGNRDRAEERQQPRSRGTVGTWNASFNLSIERPRADAASDIARDGNEMLTTNFSFQPTEMWNVRWSTGYSFSEKEFTDHILTFTRQMHDWDANFDFVKAQNGNFSFQFRVSLRANPDLKFDYHQRSNIRQNGR